MMMMMMMKDHGSCTIDERWLLATNVLTYHGIYIYIRIYLLYVQYVATTPPHDKHESTEVTIYDTWSGVGSERSKQIVTVLLIDYGSMNISRKIHVRGPCQFLWLLQGWLRWSVVYSVRYSWYMLLSDCSIHYQIYQMAQMTWIDMDCRYLYHCVFLSFFLSFSAPQPFYLIGFPGFPKVFA